MSATPGAAGGAGDGLLDVEPRHRATRVVAHRRLARRAAVEVHVSVVEPPVAAEHGNEGAELPRHDCLLLVRDRVLPCGAGTGDRTPPTLASPVQLIPNLFVQRSRPDEAHEQLRAMGRLIGG